MLTVDKIKSVTENLGKEYGAEKIFLFGSYARGEATEQSDVDFRIDKGSIRGLKLAGLYLDLESQLGVKIDLVTTDSLDEDFLSAIRKDEVLLYAAS